MQSTTLTSPKMLAHLLKYDSSQGKYALADTVEATEDSIIVDGKEIKIYAKANAEELPWGEIGVDVVLECTGFYTSKEKASAHIKAGAKKSCYFRTGRKRSSYNRIQCKPYRTETRRYSYFCSFLYNKLLGTNG